MKTIIEQLYDLYTVQPRATNSEAAEILGITYGAVKNYKHRLRLRGFIEDGPEGIEIVKPLREDITAENKTFKAEIYEEMLLVYMDDFRAQGTFRDRLDVGREIRLILEKI